MTLYRAKARVRYLRAYFNRLWQWLKWTAYWQSIRPQLTEVPLRNLAFEKALADNQRVKIGSIKLPIDKRIRRFCRPQLLALGKKTSGT